MLLLEGETVVAREEEDDDDDESRVDGGEGGSPVAMMPRSRRVAALALVMWSSRGPVKVRSWCTADWAGPRSSRDLCLWWWW